MKKSLNQLLLALLLLNCSFAHSEESYWDSFKQSLNNAKEWLANKVKSVTGKNEEIKEQKFECPKTETSAAPVTEQTEASATAAPEKK